MNDFNIYVPNYVKEIIDKLESNNYEVYLVGGCIRDTLLNKEVHDYDLVTSASLNEIKNVFKDYYIINNNGEKHNTISIYNKEDVVEVSSFRGEEGETKSIELDLLHRDFTINSIAFSFKKGLIDPYSGVKDLSNKTLKAVLSPSERFLEDPLRIFRALRFASKYGFTIEKETEKEMFKYAYKLKEVAVERLRDELIKMMVGDFVFNNVLLTYREIIGVVIPELVPCFDFNQNNRYHFHDVYMHTVHVVNYTPCDYITRIAALLHDIGKPSSYSETNVEGYIQGHFYSHPLLSYEMSRVILNRLKFSTIDKNRILFLIKEHDCFISLSRKILNRILSKIKDEDVLGMFTRLIDLKKADRKDHINLKELDLDEIYELGKKIIEENNSFKVSSLDINGYDLMSLGYKGREIKEMLNEILDLVIDEKLINEKEAILEYIKNKSAK